MSRPPLPPPPSDARPAPDGSEPDDERLWILLDRYLAGDAETREAEAVRAWLAADPSRAGVLDDLRRVREVAASRPRLRSAEEAWAALAAEVGGEGRRAATAERRRRPGKRPAWRGAYSLTADDALLRRLTAAAAVIIVAVAAAHAWRSASLPWSRRPLPAARAAAPPRVFAAGRGERAELRLIDGTRVVLAADSRLTVPAAYDSGGRDVALDGEAYFDVVHDAAKPFEVRAGGAVVRDLGTRFDLRAYAADTAVRVVVTEGSVRLLPPTAADGAGAVLGRGAAAHIDGAGRISVDQGVDTARYVAWTRGRLVFAAIPLRAAATELGRWYDVDIEIPDSALAARRLTAAIEDQPLSQVLDQLAVAFDLHTERHGRTVILTSGSGRTPRR